MNYWAPLYNEPEEDKQSNQINQLKEKQTIVINLVLCFKIFIIIIIIYLEPERKGENIFNK
jgi:hypothetical protein